MLQLTVNGGWGLRVFNLYYVHVTNRQGVTYQPLQDTSSWTHDQHLAFIYCNMLGQRKRTVINLVIPSFLSFVFKFWDRNHIIANLILLESRAVKDINKACFKMEINLPQKSSRFVLWSTCDLWWILHFAAEFDACVNKFSCSLICTVHMQFTWITSLWS
jgi:hypothetical protein